MEIMSIKYIGLLKDLKAHVCGPPSRLECMVVHGVAMRCNEYEHQVNIAKGTPYSMNLALAVKDCHTQKKSKTLQLFHAVGCVSDRLSRKTECRSGRFRVGATSHPWMPRSNRNPPVIDSNSLENMARTPSKSRPKTCSGAGNRSKSQTCTT